MPCMGKGSGQMGGYVLRVEGVNLDATAFNTQDISTIRGSSLTLENALRVWYENPPDPALKQVYCGGSQLVFHIPDADTSRAEELAQVMRDRLSEPTAPADPPAPQGRMRWVVDIAPIDPADEKPTDRAIDRATTLNRRRQLRSPTMVMPESYALSGDRRHDAVCPIDPKLPVSKGTTVPVRADQFRLAVKVPDEDGGKTRRIPVSARSAALFTYGRNARSSLYRDDLENDPMKGISYAQSFHDLVMEPPDGTPLSLQNKVAVLYFDGTGFGQLRADMGYEPFSKQVEKLFGTILPHIRDDVFRKGMKGKDHPRYSVFKWDPQVRDDQAHMRFETLLFGGEDLNIVVPSWLGWDIAQRVLGRTVQFNEGTGGEAMYLRCGLLFCNVKTPVRGARQLAHDLCDGAKKRLGEDEKAHCVNVHIVESVEVPDGGLDAQREALFGSDNHADFTFTLDEMKQATGNIADLKAGLPRSKLYGMLDRLTDRKERTEVEIVDDMLGRSTQTRFKDHADLAAVLPRYREGKDTTLFSLRLLAELSDYVDPFGEMEVPDP